eukprot:CAMPEP_0174718888 /NCGR_PEP_ID=MMETSP1094-20130205/30274_1 /TAXON_ID=156173 /ORGANISM="Chrysochromulina brevifilum, Strain UTEX LB 985" /LENGTH=187 /DNA_ID=CAMNT_0015919097 /DNA_START=160 /DNA_END=724 /DNA_ORIENTATION=-
MTQPMEASHRDKVDAVAIAHVIWQIVAQVCAHCGDRLTFLKDAHIVPHDLGIAKRRPPVRARLFEEVLDAAPHWRYVERLAGHGVVEHRLLTLSTAFPDVVCKGSGEKVATVFRIVPIEGTYLIGLCAICIPPQLGLDRVRRRAVCLAAHDALIALDSRPSVLWEWPSVDGRGHARSVVRSRFCVVR